MYDNVTIIYTDNKLNLNRLQLYHIFLSHYKLLNK